MKTVMLIAVFVSSIAAQAETPFFFDICETYEIEDCEPSWPENPDEGRPEDPNDPNTPPSV